MLKDKPVGAAQLVTLIMCLIASYGWSQVTVTGSVIAGDDRSQMPGVNVVEKGARNGTTTDSEGHFSISVTDENAILVFQFIGFETKEQTIKGHDHLDIVLKVDCIRDYFDHQHISFFLNSGVINNPLGGKFGISFPAWFGQGTLTSSLSYQTDLGNNSFLNAEVKLKHWVFNCEFDSDAGWFHRKVIFGTDFNSTGNSIELNFNFNRLGIIAGYSHLNYTPSESQVATNYNGVVAGLRTWLGSPLRLAIEGKAMLYKSKQEYFAEVTREFAHVDVFARYYQLDDFTELSLGIGTTFLYRFRKQRR
jgi:hypothetical protein